MAPNLPSVATVSISRFANQAKRYGMGRIFLGGVPQSFTLNSSVVGAGYATLSDLADQFKEPIVVNNGSTNFTLTPVLCNFRKTPANRWPVTSVKVQPVLRVQRRREVGRGI